MSIVKDSQTPIGDFLVVVSFSYVWLFNYLPEDVRIAFAGALALGTLAVTLATVLQQNAWQGRFILIAGLGMVFCWGVGIAAGVTTVDFGDAVRFLQPIVLLAFAISLGPSLSPKIIRSCAVVTLGLAAFTALTVAGYYHGGVYRIAPFTGGVEGIHSSAHAVFLAGIILLTAFLFDEKRRWVYAIAFVVSLLLMIGYAKRTNLLMLAVFVLCWGVILVRLMNGGQLMLALLLFGLSALLFLVLSFALADALPEFEALNRFGSGRLAAWADRIEDMFYRGPATLMFGSGPGTDFSTIGIWWWEEKNSHNDYIRIAYEAGALGLVLLLGSLYAVWTKMSYVAVPLFVAFVVSSGISNALLARPAVFPIFAFALGLLISYQMPIRSYMRDGDKTGHLMTKKLGAGSRQ